MKKNRTTLVLGAGSSCAFNYPTGASLRTEILSLASPPYRELSKQADLLQFKNPTLIEFIDAFRKSQMQSIDAFLARRPEFVDIGKRAIAGILLSCEESSKLDKTDYVDGWQQYLWNKISTEAWGNLDFSWLRIITFNYDKSLEQYLINAIQHSYNKSLIDAETKLSSLKIIHVYGSLGAALSFEEGYLQHGIGPNAAHIAAHSIQVIPEGRDDSPSIRQAKEHLLWANKIAFLGFGFDKTNMGRLDSQTTCRRSIPGEHGLPRNRKIYATCKGMKQGEISQAKTLLNSDFQYEPIFIDANCIDTLRESSLFD
jgi:hypothetical protein